MKLKFRAWDGEKMVSPDHVDRNGRAWWRENRTSSDKVMMWTGLTDVKGREIYEDDILGDFWQGQIAYCDKCKSFQLHYPICGCMACEGDVQWSEIVNADDLVVIGNIYQNLELLEGPKE